MKKNKWKSMLWILLSFIIFTGSIYCTPQQVSAALFTEKDLYSGEIYENNNYGFEGPVYFRVEKGITFQIGNYGLFREDGEFGEQIALSAIKGVKYSSDRTGIASVTSKGEVKTKNTGYVKIKAKFKKKSITFVLNVVEKGVLTKSADSKKLKKYVKKLKKAIPEKVNSKNCINFYTAVEKYEASCKKLTKVNETGRIKKKKFRGFTDLAVPEAGWINYANNLVRIYADRHNGYKKKSSDYIAVSSMTADAKTDTITIKLKKKLTKNQLFYLKLFAYSAKPDDGNSKKYTYTRVTYFRDLTENKRYVGMGKAKLGSDEIVLQLQDWKVTDRLEPVREDIQEGHTYQMDAEYWCPKMEAVAQ